LSNLLRKPNPSNEILEANIGAQRIHSRVDFKVQQVLIPAGVALLEGRDCVILLAESYLNRRKEM